MATAYLLVVPVVFILLPGMVSLMAPELAQHWAHGGTCYRIPIVLFLLSILIGTRLRQARHTCLAILSFGFLMIINRLTFLDSDPRSGDLVLTFAGVLFPLNVLALYYLPRRDIFSMPSFIRMLIMLLQCATLLAFRGTHGDWAVAIPATAQSLNPAPSIITIPIPALLAICATTLLMLYVWLRRGDTIAHMFVIVLISAAVFFNYRPMAEDPSIAQGLLMISASCPGLRHHIQSTRAISRRRYAGYIDGAPRAYDAEQPAEQPGTALCHLHGRHRSFQKNQ